MIAMNRPELTTDIRIKWQRLADLIVKEMGVIASFIMKVDRPYMRTIVSSKVENGPYMSGHQFELDGSFSEKVVESKEYLLVSDAKKESAWEGNSAVINGFNYFQGFPIQWPDGEIYGTISVLDHEDNLNATKESDLLKEFKVAVEQDLLLLQQQQELLAEKEKRKTAEDELRNFAPKEFLSLWEASRAVLTYKKFDESARVIFDEACKMTGATSGYVALLSPDGSENEVLFLEAGDMPCTVDPTLPMPIRGLRAESYHSHKAVYDNDFMNSKWIEFLPEGHMILNNVMFSPLNIEGKTVGIIGIANKKDDFTDFDATVAEAFGDLCAIALKNSRMLDTLHESNDKLESFNETLVEREMRIIEVKQEVNEMCKALGEELRYKEIEREIV